LLKIAKSPKISDKTVFWFFMEVFMVKLNGQTADIAGKSIAEIVEEGGYNPARVAVELNGAIVPKARYAETVVKENDTLEVVSFVGGG